MAALTGISGDKWYGFDKGGPDPIKISKEWIKDHIQIGPLGSATNDQPLGGGGGAEAIAAGQTLLTLGNTGDF
ncbi:hypothetical protein AnigIFM60653_007419 [Aspergillus niger]|nr:hypothetical protein AnigIFM60653_007419 [Aspergillus niger]